MSYSDNKPFITINIEIMYTQQVINHRKNIHVMIQRKSHFENLAYWQKWLIVPYEIEEETWLRGKKKKLLRWYYDSGVGSIHHVADLVHFCRPLLHVAFYGKRESSMMSPRAKKRRRAIISHVLILSRYVRESGKESSFSVRKLLAHCIELICQIWNTRNQGFSPNRYNNNFFESTIRISDECRSRKMRISSNGFWVLFTARGRKRFNFCICSYIFFLLFPTQLSSLKNEFDYKFKFQHFAASTSDYVPHRVPYRTSLAAR